MKKNVGSKVLAFVMLCAIILPVMIPTMVRADNPFIQTIYTADPAPMVYGDTLYVYSSHDADELVDGFFTMNDYACYSTKDMVNWTDHGIVLHVDDFGWALENRAWAPQCVERDGRFYMYTPLVKKPWTTCIGVSVADSPIGPFVPYGDTFLVTAGDGDIDPTVFIDDDGQAYLYWGNPRLYCVKLNEDMVSYDTSVGNNGIISFEMTTEAFGTRDEVKDDYPSDYEEGPWFYKRNGLYYLIYGAGGIPERLSYSTSKNPLGPWKYGGVIMDDQRGSFTNHPGIVDFMGRSYLFYHTGNLPGGGGFKRSICVEEFEYNEDGSIPKIPMTSEGPDAIDTLNPYQRTEAEMICWQVGVETKKCCIGGVQAGMNVDNIHNGDYIKVANVGFGKHGAISFSANISSPRDSVESVGVIQVRRDNLEGDVVAELEVFGTGSETEWKTFSTTIDKITGTSDLYFVFLGDGNEELFEFDYWSFTEDYVPTPMPAPTSVPPQGPSSIPVIISTEQPIAIIETPVATTVSVGKAEIKYAKSTKAKTLKVIMKKVKNASGYQITYALNSKFTKNKKMISFKSTTKVIKKLKKGRIYYIKVRAYIKNSRGKKNYGKYSNAVKVKIK